MEGREGKPPQSKFSGYVARCAAGGGGGRDGIWEVGRRRERRGGREGREGGWVGGPICDILNTPLAISVSGSWPVQFVSFNSSNILKL